MNLRKAGKTEKEWKDIEMQTNVIGGFLAGGIAAAITNPLECVTVNK